MCGMVRRRELLSTVAAGGVFGSALTTFQGRARAVGSDGPTMSHESTHGYRGERVQLVEADPEFGFNFAYWLATPETYRGEPVPLLFEMNNADKRDSYEKVKSGAESQVANFGSYQGAWLSKELGVPHLKPVVPTPDGTPIDSKHLTITLDRETMLLDGSEFERLDRQLLRMAEHARQEILTNIDTHEKLIFYGNSSEGTVAERMAAMHPEQILAAAAGGTSIAMLPLEELGNHSLKYPVGIADFESILGKSYDREAHDAVHKFYFLGDEDQTVKERLDMDPHSFPDDMWNDREVYDAATSVFGVDPAKDRFPRCHIAFHKAGVSAQFRIYEGMTHNPAPASHDILEFYRKSIAGEDVSEFGQRLELPFDREVEVAFEKVESTTVRAQFDVTGEWPPPVGLVSYDWTFGDGASGSGRPVFNEYTDPGTYEVTVSMETAHGQRAERSFAYTAEQPVFALESVELSAEEVDVGQPVTLTATVTNAGTTAGEIPVQFAVDGTVQGNTMVELDVDESKNAEFQWTFDEPGEYQFSLNGEPAGSVTVESAATPTEVTSAMTPTTTETPGQPGLGVVSTIAGIGSAVSYLLFRDRSDQD
jgi:hypothetical protein